MLESLFEEIQKKRSQDLQFNQSFIPRRNPTASDIGKCAREMTLSILHWQERPAHDERLLARFAVGNDQERQAASKLLSYGIRIVEQQSSFEHRDSKGRLVLSGHIDGKLEYQGQRVPFDYKTINPMMFERLNTIDDFLNHKFFYKYPFQLWAYEFLNNIDIGFLWLDNLLGQWKFIEIPMDWERMERALRRCEAAVESVEAVKLGAPEDKALPPYITDPAACLSCVWFKRLCLPPFAATGEGMTVVENAELAEKIRRRAELDESANEYDALDKDIKAVLKAGMKPEQIWIVGDYLVKAEEKTRNMKPQPAKDAYVQRYLSFDIAALNGKGTEK